MHFPVTHSLSTVPRLVLWAACKARWAVWCTALPSASPDFGVLVTKRLGEFKTLLRWNPLMALTPFIQEFFNSLMHYSTFPPSTLIGTCGPSVLALTP